MALYTVSMKQIVINSLLIGLVSASLTGLGYLVKEYLDLPEVWKSEGKCVKVINYKN